MRFIASFWNLWWYKHMQSVVLCLSFFAFRDLQQLRDYDCSLLCVLSKPPFSFVTSTESFYIISARLSLLELDMTYVFDCFILPILSAILLNRRDCLCLWQVCVWTGKRWSVVTTKYAPAPAVQMFFQALSSHWAVVKASYHLDRCPIIISLISSHFNLIMLRLISFWALRIYCGWVAALGSL